MMHDARFHPQPATFDTTRFLHRQGPTTTEVSPETKVTRPHFTDVGSRWPVWGLSTAAWQAIHVGSKAALTDA